MPTPRKIIQLLVTGNVLIALTDTSEIWFMHGIQSWAASGTDVQPREWRILTTLLPDLPTVVAEGMTEARHLVNAPNIPALATF